MSKFPIDKTNLKAIDSLETGDVWVLKDLPTDAFFTIGRIAADWDGAPTAYGNRYRHKDITPLDHLGNAGHTGNWWGVVTNNGKKTGTPVEQNGEGPAQPYKNYMISTTKLVDLRYPEADIRRWTDASTIPYVALPNSRRSMTKIGLKTGCYCVMIDMQTMNYCYGIYADSKAAKARMGEISGRAVELLGSSDGWIFIMAFPNTGPGQGTIPDEATIQAKAREELKLYSWMDDGDKLVKAFGKIPNLSPRLIQAGYHSNTEFQSYINI